VGVERTLRVLGMAKNKEIVRIELALKTKNEEEILWAIGYCKARLKIPQITANKKTWEKRIRELDNALTDL
jgi:hypothetical protein